jgi:cell volume regulation protein A
MTELIKGNGFLAVYIAGLVVGNQKIQHKKSVVTFFDGLTWLFQIVMFLTLGLLVNPSALFPIAGLGLVIGIFMILFSRPISVFLCLLPFRHMSKKAKMYVSWVGLRGAVPIIFATYPLIAETPHATLIFNIVFFITIVSLLVQGTTVSGMAKALHLAEKEQTPGNAFGLELSEEIKSAMSEIEVSESFLSKGDYLMDLNLPDNTLVVMVKREQHFFIPRGKTN